MPNQIAVRPPFRKRGYWPIFFSGLNVGTVTGSGGVLVGGSATVVFHGTSGQVISDVVVEWDFDNDGDFSEGVEDITSYVLSCETFTGRDWPSLLTGTAGPGKFKATLNNDDDRFNYFNTASPLNAAPFSLKTGRKLRVRTSTASSPDPTMYARDRFGRADGPLGDDETGMTWSQPFAGQFLIEAGAAVAQTEGDVQAAVVGVGFADYYVQVSVLSLGAAGNAVGLIYRYVDSSNYSYLAANTTNGSVILRDVVAGVAATVAATTVGLYSGMSVGVLVSGAVVTGYVEGVPLLSGVAIQTAATTVGIYASWTTGDGQPAIGDIQVWSGLTAEVEGILWTGDAADLEVSVTAGPTKTAELSGEGWLSKLATQKVTVPAATSGRKTGLLIGNILTACNLANPPGDIDEGDVTTGVYAVDESDAISAARDVEETEFGFLHESQEGPIDFDSRSARDAAVTLAGFSDAAGTQFGYHEVRPYDQRREVFNRVIAGVSPLTLGVEAVLYTDAGPYLLGPGETRDLVATYSGLVSDWTGHTRDVVLTAANPVIANITASSGEAVSPLGVTMPATVNAGDLLVTILQVSAQGPYPAPLTSVPSGWTSILQYETGTYDDQVLLITAKEADGAEDGTTVNYTFTDTIDYGTPLYAYAAQTYRLTGAYTTDLADGLATGAVTEWTDDPDPAVVTPAWGATASLFIAIGATVDESIAPTISAYPSGYGNTTTTALTGFFYAVRLNTASLPTTAASENPGKFTTLPAGLYGGIAVTLAVRGGTTTTPVAAATPSGTSGAFTISYDVAVGGASQSHENIEASGIPFDEGSLVQVQVDDVDSQDDHNAIRIYRNPANLFASPADATTYAELVLSTFAGDRPILSLSFYANKSAAYRNQALRRRVGDMITLVADNNAGLGISQNFFIESVGHRFSHGTTLWEVTWELSPA